MEAGRPSEQLATLCFPTSFLLHPSSLLEGTVMKKEMLINVLQPEECASPSSRTACWRSCTSRGPGTRLRRQHLQGPHRQHRAVHPGGVRGLRRRPQRLPAHLRRRADLLAACGPARRRPRPGSRRARRSWRARRSGPGSGPRGRRLGIGTGIGSGTAGNGFGSGSEGRAEFTETVEVEEQAATERFERGPGPVERIARGGGFLRGIDLDMPIPAGAVWRRKRAGRRGFAGRQPRDAA